ncbi:MAG: HAD family phosphatase [Parcubacteria group bacterium]|jgi:HAD superfamily hydrolase (TIGR01509 family)
MQKAIIFDLDGVIIDSEPIHFKASRKALEDFGIKITLADYLQFGVSMGKLFFYDKISEKYKVRLDKEAVFRRKNEYFRKMIGEVRLRSGISALLGKTFHKFSLAICSSGARVNLNLSLKKFELEKYFEVIVSGDEVERVKPYPDIYLKAISELGRKRKECIAIEDSRPGVISAKKAGIACLAIPNRFTAAQDFSSADWVFKNMKMLSDNLLNII